MGFASIPSCIYFILVMEMYLCYLGCSLALHFLNWYKADGWTFTTSPLLHTVRWTIHASSLPSLFFLVYYPYIIEYSSITKRCDL